MVQIQLHNDCPTTDTLISNRFIDDFMPQANGEFVKVYLYLLRSVQSHAYNFTISAIADKFNNTEMDIIRALRYWQKTGILRLDENPAGQICGIHMLPLYKETDPQDFVATQGQITNEATVSVASQTQISGDAIPSVNENAAFKADKVKAILEASSALNDPVSDVVETPAKRKYTLDEITAFRKDESISELFFIVETYIRHPLSESDVNTVLYWREELHFSNDLIVYLLEYCISKGHSSMRYLDKVAIGWHANNITTVEQAKEDAAIHSQAYYGVMKALGITGRSLVNSETAFIRKWTKEYAFDLALIQEECSRTISATHQPSFEYTDSILTSWHKNQVHTLDDVKRIDASYSKAKKTSAKAGNSATVKRNSFNNFNPRNYDYENLEGTLLSSTVR